MMDIKICDICKDRTKEAARFSFTYDRKVDAAGSMSDEWETYDVCAQCLATILMRTLKMVVPELFKRNQLIISVLKKWQGGSDG